MDASRNSLVMPLLGLLVEQPAHAYDLTARLQSRYAHLRVTRSTVTTLLKSMERAGTIAARPPARVEGRPPRTAYELTSAGVADFSGRIEAGLRDAPPASIDFVLAVSYAGLLPAVRVAAILQARADRLAGETGPRHEELPEVYMLEADYWRAVVTAEIDWIRRLAARIQSHDILWPAS
ncbi:Transcriptional regulator PadR-like family protein [Paractinoplanes atraurantiacus]|uniref:Transcriptional regulator PadR-like family protein n=1 Tax=Paractinoplanes atraurantiacus TaxID=1036182 RepID=A0A285HSG5_9ACTN|nr:Transcriptional regulator PadR-like family protein [Actinoplanes atraurantiacus]